MAGLTWEQVVDYYKRFGAGGSGRAIGPTEMAGARAWVGANPMDLQAALLKEPKPAAATTDPLARALQIGPTAYSPAIRKNLGLDVQQGGKFPVSGMTKTAPAFTGYKPVAAKPDPLVPLLATYKPPVQPKVQPKTPITPQAPVTPQTDPNALLQRIFTAQMGRNAR